MTYRSIFPLLIVCVLLQSACSNTAVYPEESFAYDSLFKLRTDGDVALACESARRSLLGQGYLIESASSEGVVGRKAYKSEGKENTFIEMNIVCAPDARGSTVFATGVLSTYALKMSSSSASVGLSALGSISLPIGQSADSLVKVSEETIEDKDFYRRFFAAVDTILGDLQAGKAALQPATEPTAVPAVTTPAPTPVPTPDAAPATATTPPESLPAQEVPAAVTPAPAAPTPMAQPQPAPVEVAPAPTPEPAPPEPMPEPAPEPEQLPAPPPEPSTSIMTET